MSIHGFMDQNDQIQKYDYNDLENKPTIPAEVLIDDTLTEEGQAADAKAVGDAINAIDPGLSPAAKQALLEIFQHVAFIDEYGQDYYDALENALAGGQTYTITLNLTGCESSNTATSIIEGHTYLTIITASSGYTIEGATTTATMGGQTVTGFYNNGTISIPNVTGDLVITVTAATSSVASISAVFTQGSAIIYDTYTLDVLRQYLVVTATYSDSSTATVTDYSLSGDIEAGTSVITASYGGKTATFNVTVTSRVPSAYRQVEYLQSDGTQGIMTNIIPRDTRTIVTFEYISIVESRDNFITGVYNLNNMRYYSCWVANTGEFRFSNRNNTVVWSGPTNMTGKHTVDFNNSMHQALMDGEVKGTDETFAITSGDYKLAVFCRGRDNTSAYAATSSIAKIYSARYEDNSTGNAIAELIPCYRKSDNVGGFYDIVTDTFYTDSISGNPFVFGATHWESSS